MDIMQIKSIKPINQITLDPVRHIFLKTIKLIYQLSMLLKNNEILSILIIIIYKLKLMKNCTYHNINDLKFCLLNIKLN